MPVFDPNVFDIGVFDSIFATPVLFQVYVAREMQRIAAGQSVAWTISIADTQSTPQRRYPLNVESAQVALYDPTDIQLFPFADMYNQGAGLYSFEYATAMISPKGAYCGIFKAINGGKGMLTPKMKLFEVI